MSADFGMLMLTGTMAAAARLSGTNSRGNSDRATSTAQASAPALIRKLDTQVIHTIPNRWRATSARYSRPVGLLS